MLLLRAGAWNYGLALGTTELGHALTKMALGTFGWLADSNNAWTSTTCAPAGTIPTDGGRVGAGIRCNAADLRR